MNLIKNDGSKEEFNPREVQQIIIRAFKKCMYIPTPKDSKEIAAFSTSFNTRVRDIQFGKLLEEIEEFLCSRPKWFKVGKAFIIDNALGKN